MEKLLTAKEVGKYLSVAPVTLAVWRCKRKGPKFIKIGGKSVRYSEKSINYFLRKSVIKTKNIFHKTELKKYRQRIF
tara:strand:+ start:356 stop:586 length:231 start_codon:yes stop_codon:yes gene_type:complete